MSVQGKVPAAQRPVCPTRSWPCRKVSCLYIRQGCICTGPAGTCSYRRRLGTPCWLLQHSEMPQVIILTYYRTKPECNRCNRASLTAPAPCNRDEGPTASTGKLFSTGRKMKRVTPNRTEATLGIRSETTCATLHFNMLQRQLGGRPANKPACRRMSAHRAPQQARSVKAALKLRICEQL